MSETGKWCGDANCLQCVDKGDGYWSKPADKPPDELQVLRDENQRLRAVLKMIADGAVGESRKQHIADDDWWAAQHADHSFLSWLAYKALQPAPGSSTSSSTPGSNTTTNYSK